MTTKKINMDIQTIIILILVGIGAGMLGGLVGVGGGIIIVPSLIYFLGFTQINAQGTSLGILLLPVGILGVLQFYKQGHINMPAVWVISIGFFFGSYFGSKIALSLPQDTVKKVFATLLVLIAIKMFFLDKKKTDDSSKVQTPGTTILKDNNDG